MRELRQRAEQIVRILCLILAGVAAYELAAMAVRWNPFHGVAVPDLPVLTSSDTNTSPAGSHKTNIVASVSSKDTNNPSKNSSTNSTAKVATPNSNSNSVAVQPANGSNLVAHADLPSATSNAVVVAGTNAPTNTIVSAKPEQIGTNITSVVMSTNKGTNHHHSVAVAAGGTNSGAMPPQLMMAAGGPPMSGMPPMMGGGFNPFQPGGKHGPELPAAVRSRISKINDSEILADVIHPLPMGLLGIAGNVAFLRSDNGQTGLVKEGDSLDDIKLLRIGINRVLIEQNGTKKELTIFSGYGSDSLLPKDSTHENDNP